MNRLHRQSNETNEMAKQKGVGQCRIERDAAPARAVPRGWRKGDSWSLSFYYTAIDVLAGSSEGRHPVRHRSRRVSSASFHGASRPRGVAASVRCSPENRVDNDFSRGVGEDKGQLSLVAPSADFPGLSSLSSHPANPDPCEAKGKQHRLRAVSFDSAGSPGELREFRTGTRALPRARKGVETERLARHFSPCRATTLPGGTTRGAIDERRFAIWSRTARQLDSTLHASCIIYSAGRAKRIRAFLRAADGQRFTESRAGSRASVAK